MDALVYPRERTLGALTLILGVLVWIGLIVGTMGVALIFLLVAFVLYLFFQSALIAYIKGNGVELSETQLPDLHKEFVACCDKLEVKTRPQAYVLNGDGGMNAFATKFLGTQYVILLSGVVDAMGQHADGIRFYIGHEIGHLRRKHLNWHLLRWPVMWLPLLGAAYSRAREVTCDRHGLHCSGSPESAARALAALSAGAERWKEVNLKTYIAQAGHSRGFWMSFHELTGGYPWLTKRVARVMDSTAQMPKRNPFAYLLALFVPYAGRLGGAFGILITVYIIGVLAAIAIPTYQDYVVKAKASGAVLASKPARDALADYFYQSKGKVPESLEAAGIPAQLADGTPMSLSTQGMVLTVVTPNGELVFDPALDPNGKIEWKCRGGDGFNPRQLPPACQ